MVVGVVGVAVLVGLTTLGQPRIFANRTTQHGVRPEVAPTSPQDQPPDPSGDPKPGRDGSAKPQQTDAVRIPADGPGSYQIADIAARPLGSRGALITYNVRVQKGLPFDPEDTARFVHQVLNDPRSWGRSGNWRLQLVKPGAKADIQVYLATRKTTDRLCKPLRTGGRLSCFNLRRVVLNADRWTYGAASYGDDLNDYRRNVVNHEFGHALGFGHVGCPGKGRLAPIMMQQTKGLQGCRANPWPYPNR